MIKDCILIVVLVGGGALVWNAIFKRLRRGETYEG
jgi:hypothetical protein